MLKNYWTYIKESADGLTKLIICIHNIEDYNVIAEFLDFEGFKWGNERVITLNRDYNCFKNESPDFCFILHEPGALGYGRKHGLMGPGCDYNSYSFMEGVDFIDEYINDNKKPARVRWYKKGKLNESKEDIGRKVKMRDDSRYYDEAYGKSGDGYGVIYEWTPCPDYANMENYHSYSIEWSNGVKDGYQKIDFDFIEDLEPEQPVKVRWYKKGKLVNEKDSWEEEEVGRTLVGKRVRIRKDSQFYNQAFREGNGKKGIGTGIITHYVYSDDYPFSIKWDESGISFGYQKRDFDIIEDTDEPVRVRWYKKGKLNESKEYIGKRVKMREDSAYINQAYGYHNEDNGEGIITDYISEEERVAGGLPYRITWDNKHSNSYNRRDFDFLDDLKPGKIRWYKKGKLLNEGKKYMYGDICTLIGTDEDVKILAFKDFIHVTEYQIEYQNGNIKWVPEAWLQFKGKTISKPKPVDRIRWYSNGKLRNENKKFIYNKK